MTPGAQIDRLREQGYTVRVSHRRPVELPTPWQFDWPAVNGATRAELAELREAGWPEAAFAPKGGRTDVEIISPNGAAFHGNAVCSESDSFNRRLGLQIALGRAVKQMQTFKQIRWPSGREETYAK